ncbi:hypothetical protein VTK56DRAFT_6966 [Thermocarpiscus australiensis]
MIALGSIAGAFAAKLPLLIGSVMTLIIARQVAAMLYNVCFHPLRHFPGPLTQRASAVPWAVQHALGRSGFETQKLHDRYGPVVRVAPAHLSFTDPRAWRDIYGAANPTNGPNQRCGGGGGWPELAKSPVFTSPDDHENPFSNAGYHEHQMIRRALAPGFSDASLRRQEPVVRRYVDQLLRRLHERCEGGGEQQPLNMEQWYNWTTFDIVGDLVFGEAFGCLDKCDYHPWVALILGALKAAATLTTVIYLGGRWLVQLLLRTVGQKSVAAIHKMTDEMLSRRLAMEKPRDDLFEGLLRYRKEWNLSFEKLSSNAFLLTLAGSETSATSLCGTTYLLLTNLEALEKLKREIRTAFGSSDDITIGAVSQLPYLTAVLNESMRMYPPVVSDLVRVVPPEGRHIAGHYVAGGTFVEVQPWSINHSADNWVDPWTFNPDRFLPGEEEAKKVGNILEASQPFSWGQRNCIGRNLAFAEMRMILARVVFDFDMDLADDSHNWIGRQRTYPLWNRGPLNVRLTPVRRG